MFEAFDEEVPDLKMNNTRLINIKTKNQETFSFIIIQRAVKNNMVHGSFEWFCLQEINSKLIPRMQIYKS